uniref:RIC3 acetylcholine receptor chaperone n=1 Tax=Xiphophorus maculatus TaxID=8083 RepID=M3ZXN7_XIPMA
MTITTCQKVTLISCSVLCVSLFLPKMLLPRGKNERVGPGFYPPGMHQLSVSDDPEQWEVDSSRSLTHTVEARVKVQSIGRGKKYNLMAQVIPTYGFGILLYILYIMYKVITATYPSNWLQEKLLQTEMMLDRIVSGRSHCSSSKTSTSKKEEKLLRQLRQITLLMQEGRLEGASPEMEAEEVPYGADWEGMLKPPSMMNPVIDTSMRLLSWRRIPDEETEDETEEDIDVEEEEEADDDDPLMEAESLQFSCEGSSNPEEQAEEDEEEYLLTLATMEDEHLIHADVPKEVGPNVLRMRNRRERESFTAT